MNRDLHFSAASYGLGAGLFFLSYAACEIPSNLLLYRFGARRWIARIMITWGLLAMAMMFVKTPLEFYAVRFLLGMAEAGFFPGVVYYLSQWFPASVRARTVSRFYVALPLSSVFMGGLAGALLNLQGRMGLAGWQWLFLAEGLPAVILSVIFLAYLPNTPAEAKWLTAGERDWLIERLRADNESIGESIGAPSGTSIGERHAEGVFRAILNPRVWQLGIFLLCIYIGFYAFSFSAPVLIQQATGLSNTSLGFAIAIMGVLGALGLVLNGQHSDRAGERYLHLIVPCVLIAPRRFYRWRPYRRADFRDSGVRNHLHRLQCDSGTFVGHRVQLSYRQVRGRGYRDGKYHRHCRRICRTLLDGARKRFHRELSERPADTGHPGASRRSDFAFHATA